jgi:uncharacterized protein (DUF305 family)
MTTPLRSAAMLAIAFLITLPLAASAQNAPADQAPVMDSEFSGNAAAAIRDFNEIFRNLSRALNTPIAGDVDQALARKVIALHQASIDLGQVILARGTDPELRRIAVAGVQNEASAIANIRTWLSNRELSTSSSHPSPAQ